MDVLLRLEYNPAVMMSGAVARAQHAKQDSGQVFIKGAPFEVAALVGFSALPQGWGAVSLHMPLCNKPLCNMPLCNMPHCNMLHCNMPLCYIILCNMPCCVHVCVLSCMCGYCFVSVGSCSFTPTCSSTLSRQAQHSMLSLFLTPVCQKAAALQVRDRLPALFKSVSL